MDETFAKRVREKLGEEVNPLYVQAVLNINGEAMLLWLVYNLESLGPTVGKTYQLMHAYRDDRSLRVPVDLGLRIIESHLKLALFVLEELRSRVNAIDVPCRVVG